MEKLRKKSGRISVFLFLLLFAAGIWVGCYIVLTAKAQLSVLRNSVFVACVFSDAADGWLTFFSGFLFDFLFYLLLVFLFGMTFLGVAVIPSVVFFKGATTGMALSAVLLLNGSGTFFQSWITYLPAAAPCVGMVLYFSAYAFAVSLKTCRFLACRNGVSTSLKSYWFQFFTALLILLAASAVRCILSFLAAILF